MLAGVDEAEIIGARLALLEVGGEDISYQKFVVDGTVEESNLRLGPNWD